MNEAHLHLLVNHFPIIGSIFGLGILLAGIFLKNNSVKNTAYIVFIVASVFTIASMATGEGAEEIAESLPNVGHDIIHEHEEIAEKFAIVMYLLGITSLLGLFLNIKEHAKAKFMAFAVLIIAVVSVTLSKSVGTTGGEIRHTEIREGAQNQTATESHSEEGSEENH